MLLSVDTLAAITGGRLHHYSHDAGIDSRLIFTDSRLCVPGSVYVAKPGEHADGHDFIAQAFSAGAVLTLAQREVVDSEGNPYPSLIVPDVVLAMGKIAAEIVRILREQGPLTVIGITGSAGKTTTKDLVATVLSQHGDTISPQGSYNGEVGVPLTIFQAQEGTRYLVVEMGATGIGHIEYLAELVRPDIGVVLGVGTAHAGEFGGVENIAQAKGELVESLAPQGTAVLNRDDARVAAMADRTQAKLLWFSGIQQEAGATGADLEGSLVEARNIRQGIQARPEFDLHFPDGQSYPMRSGLIGRHQVSNILAAASASWAAGIPAQSIVQALDGAEPKSRWRMERTERADGVVVLNDAYNANPESMRAALRTLAELGYPAAGETRRRTWAVLGAMYELGEDSQMQHHTLGQWVVRLNIARVLVVGEDARALYLGAIAEGSWNQEALFAPDLEAAFQLLQDELQPGDVVLFKSSNGAKLRTLGDWVASDDVKSLGDGAERTMNR